MNRLAIWKLSATAALAVASAAVPSFTVNANGGEASAVQPERAARSAARAEQQMERGRADRALRFAEEAVAFDPQNAANRAMLGQVYMASGRFASAAESFAAARQLGATDSRTLVGQALAMVAMGQSADAVVLLDANMSVIPAADYGLALALAGESQRGALILVDVARSPDATARDRQNLALAMATAGRWLEAHLIAAQDVGAQVATQRIQQWTAMLQAGDPRLRIAAVIGATPVEDPGMPVRLALNAGAGVQVAALSATDDPAPLGLYAPAPPTEYAAADAAPAEAQMPAPVEMAMAETVAPEAPVAPVEAAAAAPVELAVADAPTEMAAPVEMAAAPVVENSMMQRVITFVSIPVIQPLRNAVERTMAALRVDGAADAVAGQAPRRARVATIAPVEAEARAPRGPVRTSGWAVQLGAYDSVGVAREAWTRLARRHASLNARDGVSTSATVRGRTYYRLAATGYASRAEAVTACASVASVGGNCFVRELNAADRVQWASRQSRTRIASR